MRRVGLGDILAAARVLRAAKAAERNSLLIQMFREAELADRYARRFGKRHPEWGGGTLLDAAMRSDKVSNPRLDDPEFCACMIQVLERCSLRPRNVNL